MTSIDDDRPPAQPEIVPFKFANRNLAEVPDVPGVSWNDAVLVLLTCPVGPWAGPAPKVGIATNPFALMLSTWVTLVAPVIAYSVLLFIPWSDVQNGLVGDREMPHGLIRRGSVIVARPGTLETRLVCAYCAAAGSGAPRAAMIVSAAAAPARGACEKPKESKVRFTSGLHALLLRTGACRGLAHSQRA